VGQGLIAGSAAIPISDRMGWLMQQSAAQSARSGIPLHITEDATCWYEEPEVCYICAGIRGVQAPICMMRESFGRRVAEQVMGRRVRVVEVACAAMGAPHCKFAVWK
jgi:hypothetical protein